MKRELGRYSLRASACRSFDLSAFHALQRVWLSLPQVRLMLPHSY